MSELARGLRDVGRGLAFLNRHPRLWSYVVAPAIVTLIILVALVITVVRIADSLVTKVSAWLPSAIAGVGEWLVWGVVVIALAIGALLVFVAVAGIVAGPFCELLSEEVEQRLTGATGPKFSIVAFARGAVKGLAHAIRRLAVTLLGVVLLF
ncbi:MAG: EI24 domain-containing protein, partial [Deltaproteobacteria bacterium]|nr:EI24 domain-containing protein [Deltaproteobacteria bacterium]